MATERREKYSTFKLALEDSKTLDASVPDPLTKSHEKIPKAEVIKHHKSRFTKIKLQSLKDIQIHPHQSITVLRKKKITQKRKKPSKNEKKRELNRRDSNEPPKKKKKQSNEITEGKNQKKKSEIAKSSQ